MIMFSDTMYDHITEADRICVGEPNSNYLLRKAIFGLLHRCWTYPIRLWSHLQSKN